MHVILLSSYLRSYIFNSLIERVEWLLSTISFILHTQVEDVRITCAP